MNGDFDDLPEPIPEPPAPVALSPDTIRPLTDATRKLSILRPGRSGRALCALDEGAAYCDCGFPWRHNGNAA